MNVIVWRFVNVLVMTCENVSFLMCSLHGALTQAKCSCRFLCCLIHVPKECRCGERVSGCANHQLNIIQFATLPIHLHHFDAIELKQNGLTRQKIDEAKSSCWQYNESGFYTLNGVAKWSIASITTSLAKFDLCAVHNFFFHSPPSFQRFYPDEICSVWNIFKKKN